MRKRGGCLRIIATNKFCSSILQSHVILGSYKFKIQGICNVFSLDVILLLVSKRNRWSSRMNLFRNMTLEQFVDFHVYDCFYISNYKVIFCVFLIEVWSYLLWHTFHSYHYWQSKGIDNLARRIDFLLACKCCDGNIKIV